LIIEYLQPDANFWEGLTVVIRAGYYAASLMAAGGVAFLLFFEQRLTYEELRRLKTYAVLLAALAVLLSLIALAVRVLVLSLGESATDAAIWATVMQSRIGDAFFIRTAGLILIGALFFRWSFAPAIALIGAVAVIVSYAAMGHSMLYRPRQELAALVILHLAVVAWWAGSLPGLVMVARRTDVASSQELISLWSRSALAAVALMIASGMILIVILAGSVENVLASWHGWGFIGKMLLVALPLALAAWHKLGLTARLSRDGEAASRRLSGSILVEIVLVLLVFYAAAEMTSVHPIDYGHRIQS